uniref:Uncharacterized protein n=1 Tax=Globodera rostochiensis TaxID=31243 RepID=A0A914IC24_GLORO
MTTKKILTIKFFSTILLVYQPSTYTVLATSGEKIPQIFQEDPAGGNNDNEIEDDIEKAQMFRSKTIRDLTNEEISELVGMLRKSDFLRFNMKANESKEVGTHINKVKKQLLRIPNIKAQRIVPQPIDDDQDTSNDEQSPEHIMQGPPFDRSPQPQSSDDEAEAMLFFGKDHAKWRRWKANKIGLANIIGTLRISIDRWANEVKTNKQIKIATKNEWDTIRQNRIEKLVVTLLNSREASTSETPQNGDNGKKLVRGGPYINAALYSPEVIEQLEKQGKKILLTKKYDLVAHAKAIAEAKQNLAKYDKQMLDLAKLEAQFDALSFTKSAKASTKKQRKAKGNQKQQIAQKMIRQIQAINGVLNCLYVNVAEMVESGFTEEKKKLSKTFIYTLRKMQSDDNGEEEQTDDDE